MWMGVQVDGRIGLAKFLVDHRTDDRESVFVDYVLPTQDRLNYYVLATGYRPERR